MADAKLKIVIDAVNNAKAELDTLKRQLEGVEAPARKASGGIGGLMNALKAAGVAAAVIKFGKMAYELGEMGAQAERTEATFQRITGGAEQAAVMLDTLKAATMGTKSEIELMANATNLIALGFGESAEQLGQITRNVEALGARFGGNMQIFQLMMSNDSLMRIDSFGIGVAEATKRIEEYKAAGMEAGEAFDTAILDLMNEKFESLGGNVQDATTEILQGKAAFADFKTEAGRAFTGFTEALAGSSGGVMQWGTDILRYTRQAREEFGYLGGSLEGMAKVFGVERMKIEDFAGSMANLETAGAWSWGGGATAILDSAQAWQMYADAQDQAADAVKYFGDFSGDSATAFDQYSQALLQGEASINTTRDAAINAANAMQAYRDAQLAAADSAAIAATAFYNTAAALSEMGAAQFAQEQLSALKQALDDGKISQQDYADATREILTELGLLTQAEENAQGDIAALRQAFLDGKINAEQFADMLAKIKSNLDALEDKTVNVRVVYTEEHRAAGAGAGQSSENYVPPMATGGVSAGGYTLVGERGPELVNLPGGAGAGESSLNYPGSGQATGGVARGGWTMVGERGPEMVNLPGGAHVMNHQVTNNYNNSYNLSMNTRATSGTVRQDFALLRALG